MWYIWGSLLGISSVVSIFTAEPKYICVNNFT